MSRTFRSIVSALALVACVGSGVMLRAQQGGQSSPPQAQPNPSPQQPPPPPQQPTFKAGISFVRVDAIVNDRQGNPITDLKVSDFQVFEDNKPQKIETFKLVNLGSATQQQLNAPAPVEIRNDVDQELEAARDDVRVFAIFLDDYHVRLENSMSVRAALSKFVDTQLGPNDLVEVMYPLTPVSGLLLTRDHEAIARVIEKFVGRKYDYRPRNEIEDQYQNYPAATIEQLRNEVSLTAIKGLVTHLGGLREGRKAIILVSEGYTALLPPQLRDPIASMPGMMNPARGDPNAGDNAAEDRANWSATNNMMDDLRNVYDVANHNNTSIYSVDPRGLATNEFDLSQPAISGKTDRDILQSTQDTLHVLSDNTDGRAIMNRNDLIVGLRQIVRDSSAYYLIGYSSTQPPSDGKFHEIKVRVQRSGAEVRARKGYWAPTEEDRAKAMAPPKPPAPLAVTNALGSLAQPPSGQLIRTWVGTSRGENGKTRVTFVWEPVPPPPGTTPPDRPMRVSVVASAKSGETYFHGRVPDDVAAPVTTAVQPSGAASMLAQGGRVVFEVPPGKLQMRLSVEGTKGQVIDTDAREVEVPDLTAPQVVLTTPAVFSARTARDFKVLMADANATPTAIRQFSRTERLLIRFEAYAPGSMVPAVTVRLLNRGGQEIAPLTAKPGDQHPEEQSVDLPLAGFAAGEYVLEIKAKDAAGEASQMVAIRVTA